MKNYLDGGDMPMGLTMAMAKNQKALDYFSGLTPAERQKIVDSTSKIRSKKQMNAYVDSCFDSKFIM